MDPAENIFENEGDCRGKNRRRKPHSINKIENSVNYLLDKFLKP